MARKTSTYHTKACLVHTEINISVVLHSSDILQITLQRNLPKQITDCTNEKQKDDYSKYAMWAQHIRSHQYCWHLSSFFNEGTLLQAQ